MATRISRKPAVTVDNKSSDTVIVCFKSHVDQVFEVNDRKIVIRGHNSKLRGVNGGYLDSGHAFGETEIKRDDWDAIVRKYFQDPNQHLYPEYIFAKADKADARAEAKEKAGAKTGFEPIDTAKTRSKADKE